MVIDRLANAALYRPLGRRLAAALDWLGRNAASFDAERHEIDGTAIFALTQNYETVPAAEKRYEAHRRYIDIQYVCAGTEAMQVASAASLSPATTYDEAKDFILFADPDACTTLRCPAGTFAVFFPDDAHKPGLADGGRTAIRKIVIKVLVDS